MTKLHSQASILALLSPLRCASVVRARTIKSTDVQACSIA